MASDYNDEHYEHTNKKQKLTINKNSLTWNLENNLPEAAKKFDFGATKSQNYQNSSKQTKQTYNLTCKADSVYPKPRLTLLKCLQTTRVSKVHLRAKRQQQQQTHLNNNQRCASRTEVALELPQTTRIVTLNQDDSFSAIAWASLDLATSESNNQNYQMFDSISSAGDANLFECILTFGQNDNNEQQVDRKRIALPKGKNLTFFKPVNGIWFNKAFISSSKTDQFLFLSFKIVTWKSHKFVYLKKNIELQTVKV